MTTSSVGVRDTVRTAPRLLRILRILAKHGFVGAVRGKRHWPAPAQVRETLEELGVVFLKFGQVLALRRDLLADAYVAELERLHDRLPPMDFGAVQATVERELGGPLEQLFGSFDPVPLAAATIAQVHAATLSDGRPVVVKVRRAGLDRSISRDIATLTYLAALAEQLAPRLNTWDLVGMVREFRDSLQRETDFRLEAQTIRRFRDALADAEDVWIPDVVPERSGPVVLTMEHSAGVRIDRYAAEHPEAGRRLAASIAALVLHQVFENGLFHADPHPGNVFVLPNGRICLHDFGMIGEMDQPTREGLTGLLEAGVRGDARAATDAYLDLGLVGGDVDRAALEADIAGLLRKIRDRPLAEVSVGDALQSLVRIGSTHRVRNPGIILLLARAFLVAEAVMRHLDPELNVLEVFAAEVKRITARAYSPARLLKNTERVARDVERLVREAPTDLRRALRHMADGELGRVHVPGLEGIGRRASRDLERLTGAVASAALIVAGALLGTASGWHQVAGDVLLAAGIAGTLAVALGAWRARRR